MNSGLFVLVGDPFLGPPKIPISMDNHRHNEDLKDLLDMTGSIF